MSLFCDLFASHAPLPDKRVEAITGAIRSDRGQGGAATPRCEGAGDTPQIPLADGSTPESAAG